VGCTYLSGAQTVNSIKLSRAPLPVLEWRVSHPSGCVSARLCPFLNSQPHPKHRLTSLHRSIDFSAIMSTTKITLTSLPLEIVQQVADCIETVHRPSLFAFSLTSKACHRAAAFLLFRKISFMVHDCEGLRRDADRLVEALSRTDSAPHVQCISIKGACSKR
jgi:hypothetical protein